MAEENKEPRVIVYGTYNEIHDNNFYGGNHYFTDGKKNNGAGDEEQELTDMLSPFFFDEEEEATKFIKDIKGKKATDVTAAVNTLLRKGKISKAMCYKPLYDILHHYGFYDKTLSNWNGQIKG